MYVHVTEEHQDVASLPGVGSDIQTTTSRELLIHWDQGVVGEVLLPGIFIFNIQLTTLDKR